MDDLYVENFFHPKARSSSASPTIEPPVLTTPAHSLKIEQQTHSFLWLLKQEMNKSFPSSFPVEKLIKQIETGFSASHYETVIQLLEQLEELIDAYSRQ